MVPKLNLRWGIMFLSRIIMHSGSSWFLNHFRYHHLVYSILCFHSEKVYLFLTKMSTEACFSISKLGLIVKIIILINYIIINFYFKIFFHNLDFKTGLIKSLKTIKVSYKNVYIFLVFYIVLGYCSQTLKYPKLSHAPV